MSQVVMDSERASQRAFLGVSALLFAASVAVTIVWCASILRDRWEYSHMARGDWHSAGTP